MRASTERILTTHAGSLPRSDAVVALQVAVSRGEPVDSGELDAAVLESTAHVIDQQLAAGIDIGTGAVKTVLFRNDDEGHEWLARRVERIRRRDPLALADTAYREMLAETGIAEEEVGYVATTGERIYRQRVGGGGRSFTASPVAADGRLYFTEETGTVHVVRAGRNYEELATNEMGEVCMATPAIAGSTLYVRTLGHVYAIAASR